MRCIWHLISFKFNENSFTDEPGKPGNLRATDWDKDHVDLKWEPPKVDGGSPITGYVVEVKDKFGNWEKAVTVPAGVTSATVPGLTEGEPYVFQVRAINAAGPGEASDPTPTIWAKPRNQPPKIDRANLIEVPTLYKLSVNHLLNITERTYYKKYMSWPNLLASLDHHWARTYRDIWLF